MEITLLNQTVFSDADEWNLFVPIRDVYNISVSKDGYETVFYSMDDVSGFVVNDDTVTMDIEIEANNVLVSGLVTTALPNPELQLNGSSITLYPSTDYYREPITIDGTYSNGTLSWSEIVVPGDWIVVVESSNLDDNGGGIAIAYLDANINEGAILEMEMVAGGWVEVSTNWDDINLIGHHTGSSDPGYSMIESEVQITFDLRTGARWNYTVDENGSVRVLMPVGEVLMESLFNTNQRNLSMPYSFTSVRTVEQGILDVENDYSRKIKFKDLNFN